MQPLVRRTLAAVLLGVIAQRLLPRASKQGRVALLEVLLPDDALREALRAGRPLAGLTGGAGSIARADELARFEATGAISAETAERARQSLVERPPLA